MALIEACDVLHQVFDYHLLDFDDSNYDYDSDYDYDWRALLEAYDILAPSSSIMMIIQLFSFIGACHFHLRVQCNGDPRLSLLVDGSRCAQYFSRKMHELLRWE